MKEIKINNSDISAIVDDEDFDRLCHFNYRLNKNCILRQEWVQSRVPQNRSRLMANDIMKDHYHMYDHKDRNVFNMSKLNLRVCSVSQNAANRKKLSGTSSKYKGVSFVSSSSMWRACIRVNGRKINLGNFVFEDDAGKAYDKAAIEKFGEFAVLNFPLSCVIVPFTN